MRMKPLVRIALLSAGCLAAACSRPAAPERPSLEPVARGQRPDEQADADKDKSTQTSERDGSSFAFPADKGGKLLARELPPPQQVPSPEVPVRPRSLPTFPRGFDRPDLPLPPSLSDMPRPPAGTASVVKRPQQVLDEPFPTGHDSLTPPETPLLPAGAGVRLPSPDATLPVPLPLLAQPQTDRASLDDPTVEASLLAALSEVPPLRVNPAPFQRLALPDPFEHRETVRLRVPLAEETSPVAAAPQLPK
jgi:hypothetical protein